VNAVLWVWLIGAVVTLALLRACMVTRGALQPRPAAHRLWIRQTFYALVWPVFWPVLHRAAVSPAFRRRILGWV
jgi:hypothetical protein